MEEEKLLKKQFFLHVIYNLIAFSVIFVAFGIFVFFMVRNITFSSADKQLKEAKGQLTEMNVKLEILYKMFDLNSFGIMDMGHEVFSRYNIAQKIDNPQIIFVLRDKNGQILNQSDLGRIQNYSSEIEFNNQNLDKIYKLELGNKYNYRCINFVLISAQKSQNQYVQLLINVDSEIALIDNYSKIIAYAVVFGCVISGIASLILSRKTLKPVEEILQNQTEFVQNASHELRTPLTIIQAKQELLLQEPNSRIIDKSEDIMLTLTETKRLTKLTKDLMTLVRGTNIKLQKEDVNIDEFIQKIVLPYKDILEAQEKEFVLDFAFDKEIFVDINKIHQLIIILLDNAIKYTESGDTIKIATFFKDNKCVIEVADTGIGISDEGLKHIFERFYREDKDRNRETGGSGLGLAIATMIVNAHNGTIKASHNNPKGTIFTVKFSR